MLALLLAACSGPPVPPRTDQSPSPSPSVAASRTLPETTAPIVAERSLDDMLPAELGGVELHTFAVGEDALERLAVRLGLRPEELGVRNASEHGARFLQMYAIRAPGVSGRELLEAWDEAAYPEDILDATSTQRTVSGKAVTATHSPSAASRLGTYYSYSVADTLLVVQAFDREVAAEALAALP